MNGTTLPLVKYPATHASELINDSGVTGANVADALDELQDEISAIPTNAILKDGSVDFTGDQSFGGHKATHLADPTTGTDAANKQYVDAGDAATLAAANAYTDAHGPTVSVSGPTTVDAVPAWSSTSGALRPSAAVKIHSAASDKHEVAASFEAVVTDADAATITYNLNASNVHMTTLGGNRTLAYTNASVGQRILILLQQDAIGGRSVTWWANIHWANGVAPVLDSTAATGWNLVELECLGVDSYMVPVWYEIGRRGSNLAGSIFHTNSAGELVQLDGTGKLPALDGSQLTGITSGNGAHRLVTTNSSATYTILDADDVVINNANADTTLTLSNGASYSGSKQVTLVNFTNTHLVTINRSGSDTFIDFSGSRTSLVLQYGDVITIAHIGSGSWVVLNRRFAGHTTGSGTPALGSNCPATTLTAPFAWIKTTLADGSVVYVPAWR